VACTIVARNYVGFARVLEQSFLAEHGTTDFVTLIIDGTEEDRRSSGLAEVLLLDDLVLPAEVVEPMAVMYGVTELATALKPAMLRVMLERGYDAAAYFDPDILITGDVTDVFEVAEEAGIVLTPHTLAPVPRDGLEISERVIMRAGIFNLGFIAVGSGATPFLDWWHERLTTDAVIDFEHALFTDQRWVDWVPALFPFRVLRDPGLNVAYWNLHERPLSRRADGGVLAAGSPLRFVHFSGFDLAHPWVLSRFTGELPRVMVSADGLLQELCARYATALTEAGHLASRRTPYGYDAVPGGPVLSADIRRVYRDALVGLLPFPDVPRRPWSEPEELRQWLTCRVWTSPWSQLSPAEYALWSSRRDLRGGFPSPFGASGLTFRRWLDSEPSVSEHYRRHHIEMPQVLDEVEPDDGWAVVVGGFPRPSGQVEALARDIASGLTATGVGVSLHLPEPVGVSLDVTWHRIDVAGTGEHANRIVCIDADRFAEDRLVQMIGDPKGVCVGVWVSADPSVDVEGCSALPLFDELWVVTPTAETTVREAATRPVHRVHVPTSGTAQTSGDGAREDREREVVQALRSAGPVVLLELDAWADHECENPEAAIAAYRSAFPETDGGRLLVDVRFGEPSRRRIDSLQHASGGRADIRVLTPMSRPERVESLAADVDIVVSLHRTDALGRPVLAALEAGVPAVTSDFAGASHLIGSDDFLVPAAVQERPGRRPSVCAEPDVEAAAKRLRTMWLESDRARSIAAAERARLGLGLPSVADRATALTRGAGATQRDRAHAASLRRTLVSDHEGLGRVRGLRAQVALLEQQVADARLAGLGRVVRRLRTLVTGRR
jgi:glycosyltransferase involved in cell wall biosynthesis